MNKLYLIVLTVFAVILAGCGGTSATRPTTAPAALGDFPIGAYSIAGLTWKFKADGSYSIAGIDANEQGVFTVTGNKISLTGNCCGDMTGIYTWTYDDTALKFELINDDCTTRAGIVANGKWAMNP